MAGRPQPMNAADLAHRDWAFSRLGVSPPKTLDDELRASNEKDVSMSKNLKSDEAVTESIKKLVTKAALCVLDVERLQVDPSYQRGVKAKHRRIVEEFDETALGIPLVGQREDGGLWIVDGLQRITALKKLGRAKVRAEVFRSDGPEHEAKVFKLVNLNRTRLSPQEEFKALLTAHDALAWQIKQAVESVGYRLILVSENGTSIGKGGTNEMVSTDIACVTTLRNVAEESGVEPIKFALLTAKDAWPGDRLNGHNNVVGGLCCFWQRLKGVVDMERLLPRLRTVTPHKLIYAAAQMNLGGNKKESMATALEKVYRKRLNTRAGS